MRKFNFNSFLINFKFFLKCLLKLLLILRYFLDSHLLIHYHILLLPLCFLLDTLSNLYSHPLIIIFFMFSVIKLLRCLLLFDGFRVFNFLCKKWQILGHLCQMLNIECFSLRVSINIVLSELLLNLLLLLVHERIEFFYVDGALAEIKVLVELGIKHDWIVKL